jgi:hypothetical protein
MEDLKNIKRVSPSPFLKDKVMERVKHQNTDTPKTIKWLAAAAVIINIIVVSYYLDNNQQNTQREYEILTTESIINY